MLEFLVLAFLIFIGILLIQYYIEEWRARKLSPPGPWPIPLLGNTIQIATASSQSHLAFSKLAQKYGDIFRVKLGEYEHIILTSTEAIMDVFEKEETVGRNAVGVLEIRKGNKAGLGMAWSDGQFWAKKRAWTLRKLRESGFGKSSPLEMYTKHEIQSLLQDWDSQLSNGTNEEHNFIVLQVSGLFILPITKIMWKIMIGRLNEEDEAMMKMFFSLNREALAFSSAAGLTLIAPTICKTLFPSSTGYTAMHNLVTQMNFQAKKYLKEFSNLPSQSLTAEKGNLVQEYIQQMKEFPKDFFEEDFAILFLDLMQGGSDTTSSLLEYLMLYMILNPDVQEKVYQEIQNVLPSDEERQDVTVEDMDKMLYTQATILEAQRLAKIIPLLVPKRVTRDFVYRNYLFKKNTTILGDLFTAFHSGEFEKDSKTFLPERYLKRQNPHDSWEWNGLQKKVVCFGYGKRICPGQRMTEIVSFLTFTTLIRRYKLFIVPNEPSPEQSQIVGFTSTIKPFRMAIAHRRSKK